MAKIVAFSSIQLDRFYSPLGKSVNISVQHRLSKSGKFSNIINENNMSALNNYLEKNNASVYIEDLGGDFFHDVKFHVFKRGKSDTIKFPFSFAGAKEDFANCMRSLYKNVENALKTLKG